MKIDSFRYEFVLKKVLMDNNSQNFGPFSHLQLETEKVHLMQLFAVDEMDEFWTRHKKLLQQMKAQPLKKIEYSYYNWLWDLLTLENYAIAPIADFFEDYLDLLILDGDLQKLENVVSDFLNYLLISKKTSSYLRCFLKIEKIFFSYKLQILKLKFLILQNDDSKLDLQIVLFCGDSKELRLKLKKELLVLEDVYEDIISFLNESWSDYTLSVVVREFILRYYLLKIEKEEALFLEKSINMLTEVILIDPLYMPSYLLGAKIYYLLNEHETSKQFLAFIDTQKKAPDMKAFKRIDREYRAFLKIVNDKNKTSSCSLRIQKKAFNSLSTTILKQVDFARDLFDAGDLPPISEDAVNDYLGALWKSLEAKKSPEELAIQQDFLYVQDYFLSYFERNKEIIRQENYTDWVVGFNFMQMYRISHKILTVIEDDMETLERGEGDSYDSCSLEFQLKWCYLKAQTHYLENDFRGAMIILERVNKLYPLKQDEIVTFYYLYGEIWEKLGQKKFALEWFSKVALIDGDYRYVKQRITRLEET